MTTRPIEGQRYRVVGRDMTLRNHRGKIGVALHISSCGKGWQLMLSNLAEWGSAWCTASEIEPVEEANDKAAPKPATSPGVAPKLQPDAFVGAESELVAAIKKALTAQGYLSCQIGQIKAKGSGTTIGYPDLDFRRSSWPRGMSCHLEVKTSTGAMEPEQAALYADGWSYVVRSVAEAVSALTRFENEVFGCK